MLQPLMGLFVSPSLSPPHLAEMDPEVFFQKKVFKKCFLSWRCAIVIKNPSEFYSLSLASQY